MEVYNSAFPAPLIFRGPAEAVTSGTNNVRTIQGLPPSHQKMQRRREHQNRQPSRLPPIAPRDHLLPALLRTESTGSTNDSSLRSPRTRLPPRSRSGCWTCRTRKVKCDEGRPCCNQCIRLGHVCDYNPRLAFKDETAKIVDKYFGGGSSSRQWDTSKWRSLGSQRVREVDRLPPFSTLTTEEDWEKKAGHSVPGTYYVIANSSSFPTSGEGIPSAIANQFPPDAPPSRRQSLFSATTDTNWDESLDRKFANTVLDEETLILGSLDETSRHSQSASQTTSFVLQLESTPISPDSPFPMSSYNSQADMSAAAPTSLPYPVGRYTQADLRRLHYRTIVRTHVFSNKGSNDLNVADIFEQEAESFPLLGAAIDELAAWSLAANGGLQNFDTQERYLEILASLRKHNNEADFGQDGMFLTHVLLLVYEISASHRSWQHHLAALLHIFQRRGGDLVRKFPHLICWITYIDVMALLCGSGPGKFADFVFDNNLAPCAADFRAAAAPSALAEPTTPIEWQSFMKLIEICLPCLNHARQLGHLSRFFRQHLSSSEQRRAIALIPDVRAWQQQALAARSSLQQTWNANIANIADCISEPNDLPEISAVAADTVWFTYHALLLYSHTSMWPTQRSDEGYTHDAATVAQCCTAIIERASEVLNRGNFSRRLVVYPLFLAGFFSIIPMEKKRALELLYVMEQTSIGNNTRATRRWLERLYAEQAMVHEPGMSLQVDWIQKIQEQDFCIIHAGF